MNNLGLSFLDEMSRVTMSQCGGGDRGVMSLHSIMYTGWAGAGLRLVPVEVVDPGVAPGALLLARGELPHVPLVLQLTPVLLTAAAARPVREVAVEDGRGVHLQHGQLRLRGQLGTTRTEECVGTMNNPQRTSGI